MPRIVAFVHRGNCPIRKLTEKVGLWCLIGTEDLDPGPRGGLFLTGQALLESGDNASNGARREDRVYKYMHIYLCSIPTIRFLEVGPARRTAGGKAA